MFKNIILGLVLLTLGVVAQARTANINCVTEDKEFINLTALIDHAVIEQAQMEVISTRLYPDREGNSSGGMSVHAIPNGGQYWYGSNDGIRRYHYGLYIPNELIFKVQRNYQVWIHHGVANNNGQAHKAWCNSNFED